MTLAAELARDPQFTSDPALLAAFFVAGYAVMLVETARRVVAGDPPDTVAEDHRVRLEELFEALRHGVGGAGQRPGPCQ